MPDGWPYGGDTDRPTFNSDGRCHTVIKSGRIRYCAGSWHGRLDAVAMPPIPDLHTMSDDITTAIADATDRLIARRVIIQQERRMPLEIKGLKANMLKVAQRIERINQKAIAFDELGGSLESGLDDITAQVKAHGSDLEFSANVLGNSTSETTE